MNLLTTRSLYFVSGSTVARSRILFLLGILNSAQCLGFGSLGAVFRSAAFSISNTGCIQGSTHNVIANSWKILHPTTTNQDHRVLLKVVTNTSDISSYFLLIRESHPTNFSKSRIRFLRSHRINPSTDPSFLRSASQGW